KALTETRHHAYLSFDIGRRKILAMEELKDFPVSKLKPNATSFGGCLNFNPYCDLPPTIWYGMGIALEPFDLGESAPDPEYFGTTVDTTLSAGGIVLPIRDW